MALIVTPAIEQSIAEFATSVRKHDRVLTQTGVRDMGEPFEHMIESLDRLKAVILEALEDAYYRKNGV